MAICLRFYRFYARNASVYSKHSCRKNEFIKSVKSILPTVFVFHIPILCKFPIDLSTFLKDLLLFKQGIHFNHGFSISVGFSEFWLNPESNFPLSVSVKKQACTKSRYKFPEGKKKKNFNSFLRLRRLIVIPRNYFCHSC